MSINANKCKQMAITIKMNVTINQLTSGANETIGLSKRNLCSGPTATKLVAYAPVLLKLE